jgi:hypothetical protein
MWSLVSRFPDRLFHFFLSGRAEVVVCVFLEMAAAAAESRDVTPPKTSRFY